jgi:hypothetical protein
MQLPDRRSLLARGRKHAEEGEFEPAIECFARIIQSGQDRDAQAHDLQGSSIREILHRLEDSPTDIVARSANIGGGQYQNRESPLSEGDTITQVQAWLLEPGSSLTPEPHTLRVCFSRTSLEGQLAVHRLADGQYFLHGRIESD